MKTLIFGISLLTTLSISSAGASCLSKYSKRIAVQEKSIEVGGEIMPNLIFGGLMLGAASGVFAMPFTASNSGAMSHAYYKKKQYEEVFDLIKSSYRRVTTTDNLKFLKDIRKNTNRFDLLDSEIMDKVVLLDMEDKFCKEELPVKYEEFVTIISSEF